jgi:minor extracellular serine protease Vpr
VRHRIRRRSAFAIAGLISAVVAAGSMPADAQTAPAPTPDFGDLRISGGPVSIDASLARIRSGPVEVIVRLAGESVAQTKARGQGAGAQQARARQIAAEQDTVARVIRSAGGRELGRVSRSANAIAATVDASAIATIAAAPGVVAVSPVKTYEMDLSETVPYIGGRAGAFAQPGGADGTGVVVAVLDSGVDYTHANLGGPGTDEAYKAAYGVGVGDPLQTTLDGLFPTAKVVGGYDFVGELWPTFGARSEDPDPIDFEGHGTHVADIIAGVDGVAPGASILAVKVCSAVSPSCNGIALLKGMDFALDPNGDGSIEDAVDIINMSLGASYGQSEDDLSFAAANAVAAGVTVVASAGNSADRPYIVGSPSSAPGVISVAQTQVPGAVAFPLTVTGITPQAINNTATLDWAPVGSGFTGEVVQVGQYCPSVTTTIPETPATPAFNGNSPAGKVALIDRGTCAISLKVDRATKAGAIGVLIANNAAGDPPSFSFGGGDLPMVPSLVITLADGNRIKAALGGTGVNPAVVASVGGATSVPLVGSMVASSSRGPSMSSDEIKPDIGAPGASVSAIAGSGTDTGAFGGTSGAAPMVAGAAALLLSTGPMDPLTVKARLMGSAETDVLTNPRTQPGVLAPITRIGGGEVRADRAAAVSTVAFDSTPGGSGQPSLSFGAPRLTRTTTLERRLTVRNLSNQNRTYTLTPSFRYADDQASGAVTPSIVGGNTISVQAGRERTVTVRLVVDPSRLPAWPFAAVGGLLGNGGLLNGPEFDGYVRVSGGGDTVTVPWHVLPRAAGDITANRPVVSTGSNNSTVTLSANGPINGGFSAYALTGTSGRIPRGQLAGAGENKADIDLRAVGVRTFAADNVVQFAVSTWDERSHPAYPAGFEIAVDSDRDGNPDWLVFQQELGTFASTGTPAVYVQSANGGPASAFFFLLADLNSTLREFTVPMSALGIAPGQQFDFSVLAYDNYFSGVVTDSIGTMTYTAEAPRYVLGGVVNGEGVVTAGGSTTVPVSVVPGGAAASPSQTGFMLFEYDGATGNEVTLVEARQ